MTETGEYIIQYYSRKGTKLKDLTETAECLLYAEDLAKETLHMDSLAKSYTIDLRLQNSMDSPKTWG